MKIQKSILVVPALVWVSIFLNIGLSTGAASPILVWPPFDSVTSYQMHAIQPRSFGAYITGVEDLTDASTGKLRQYAYVTSSGIAGTGMQVNDALRDTFRVDESGEYRVTFRVSLNGTYANFGYYKLGAVKGALKLKLIAQVHTLNDKSERIYDLYDEELTVAQFVNDAVMAEFTNLCTVKGVGLGPMEYILLAADIMPKKVWHPRWDVFDVSCRVYLRHDIEHWWQIQLQSNMASASVALGGQATALDLTAQLERVEVQLVSKDASAIAGRDVTLAPNPVDSGNSVAVSGKAYYDNGLPVKAGTATISLDGRTYTTPVVNGQFERTLTAPTNNQDNNIVRNVGVKVSDGRLTSAEVSRSLTIRGRGVSGPVTIRQAMICQGYLRTPTTTEPYDWQKYDVFGKWRTLILLWVELANVPSSGCEVRWKYYRPSGRQMRHGGYDLSPVDGESTVRTWDEVNMQRAMWEDWLDWEGQWRVDIYVDGIRQKSLPFYMRYVLGQYVMCQNVTETNPRLPVDRTNTFYQTSAQAVGWRQLEKVAEALEIKTEAFEPNGSVYTSWSGSTKDPSETPGVHWATAPGWSTMAINGTQAEEKCGDWSMKLSIKDRHGNWKPIHEEFFRILEDPAVRPEVTVVASPDIPTALQESQFTVSATDNTYLKDVTLHLKIDGQLYEHVVGSDLNRSSYEYTSSHGPFIEGQRVEYWATATDTSGNTGHSSHRSFAVKAACSNLSVVTELASDVTESGATLHGYLADDEGFACTCSFMYRHLDSDGEWNYATLPDMYRRGEHFEVTMSDLMPQATYEFAAVAWNAAGCETTGDVDRFFTGKEDPVVVTVEAIKDATSNKVILIGRIDDDGQNACIAGFMYGALAKHAAEPVWQYVPSEGSACRTGDSFVATVGQLAGPYVDYYFYAMAENVAGGVGIGAEKAFSSLIFHDDIVKTLPPDIVGTTVTMNGTWIPRYGNFEYGFRYGLASEDPSTWSLVWASAEEWLWVERQFSVTLEGLEPNTHYGYRAVAQQGLSMVEDDHIEFFATPVVTTPVDCPVVRTDGARIMPRLGAGPTQIDAIVTLSGTLLDDGGEACETRFYVRLEGTAAPQEIWSPWKGWYESGASFSHSFNINPTDYPGVRRIVYSAEARNSACSAAGNERVAIDLDSSDIDPPNSPPILEPIGNRVVTAGNSLAFTVRAADPDGDPLTYWASNLPPGASFVGQTFSWTPSYDQVGTYQVTFEVTDGLAQDSETMMITVTDAPPEGATTLTVRMTVDDNFDLYLSTDDTQLGTHIGSGNPGLDQWRQAFTFECALTPGVTHYLHVVGRDIYGVRAGFVGEFSLSDASFEFANHTQSLVTDSANWSISNVGFGQSYYTPDAIMTNAEGWGGSVIEGISASAYWIWSNDGYDLGTRYFSSPILPTTP